MFHLVNPMKTNIIKVEMYFLDVVEHAEFHAPLECPMERREFWK